MKVDFPAYNTPVTYCQHPAFTSKEPKVDWESDSGERLEKVLKWMGTVASAGITEYKNNKDTIKLDDDEKAILDSYLDFDEKSALVKAKTLFEESYKKTKDDKILDKHFQLYKDAFKNRYLLRGGYSDLNDYELTYALMDTSVISALNLLGKGVLESAFSLDVQGFENFCEDIDFLQSNISRQNLELLKMKINPESTDKYRDLEEKERQNKRKITKLLGKENNLKRKELLEQIEVLKADKSSQKEIKELKKQIQDLYKNCENSSQISELMSEVKEIQKNKKELLAQKVNLSPQQMVNKVWTISAISKSPRYDNSVILLPEDYDEQKRSQISTLGKENNGDFTLSKDDAMDILGEDYTFYVQKNTKKLNKDIKVLINLIQPETEENEKAWKDNINKKLYEYASIKYNGKFADKINLANSKYLNEMIISDSNFWNIMTPLLQAVAQYHFDCPNKTNDDALDDFLNNVETKEIFTKEGIDYYKWSRYDKNSYIESPVTIKAQDAKEKAVKNLCDDLTGKMLRENIPSKERKSLYKALNNAGITINRNNVKIDGRQVEFEDLDLIMSVIKTEFNKNTFWSFESPDEKIDKARDIIYTHLMLQRKQEIDCAKRLKESETADIRVQKVDMADIKHSLSLGNDSHCCTALGSQSNEWSAPAYIINRCISAIEVLANGQAVGNTMIYPAYIKNENENTLALVLDDIELQTKFQNNEKIKNMIIDYAKKLCAEIGKPDIPIYAGPGLHKVDMSEYLLVNSEMQILGKSADGCPVYLDFDGDAHDIGDITEKTDLYKIA